jgi:small subunit ribosomal protein S1
MQSENDAPIRALDGPEYIEVDGEMIPNYDLTMPTFEEGDVVTGRVVRIDKDEVLVDIGYKSEGVIPSNELSIRKSVNPADEVEMHEMVDALVLQKEDQEGRLILSKKRARFERAWKKIEEAAANSEIVTGRVIEVVKGGLILDLGVRGFLPASLVDIRRVQDLDEFMGQELECKVIELNRSRNNVVLSRRAVIEDERKEVRQKILDELQPGAVVEGVISNIVDFGAFVDLEGIDGLIHISELSWTHVNHPSEVLAIGDTVEVKVLDIDRDRQRISLGLKQTQADPWQSVVEAYQVGDVVAGKVTKVVTFGAFVEIHAGVEGLVHISELAEHHVENPREVVAPDQDVAVRIIEIDGERRRLSLSLKRASDVSVDEGGDPHSERVYTDDGSGGSVEPVAGAPADVAPADAAAVEEPVSETAETPASDAAPEEPADHAPADATPEEAGGDVPTDEPVDDPPADPVEATADETPADPVEAPADDPADDASADPVEATADAGGETDG